MATATAAPAAETSFGTPVSTEIEAFDLPVEGALPPELCGDYIRNGPNPRPGAKARHLFLGDGMLHGLRIENGRATAYRNRWVRTREFVEHARLVRLNGTVDLTVGTANTNIIGHGNRLLALVESSFPTEVTRELTTTGVYDFDGRLTGPFSAHPHRCPRTGELHGFGMQLRPGALLYYRIDAAGKLMETRNIPVRSATMMHDFALTDRYAIFMDLPIVFDMLLGMRGKFPFRWSDRYGARLGVVDRNDAAAPVRWFEIEPSYVFHVMNAVEDGERIALDVVRYQELWRKGNDSFAPTTLHRFTIDLASGRVSEATLADRSVEFPRIDERLTGNAYRYGYAVAVDAAGRDSGELCKFDLATGTSSSHRFGAGRRTGEAVFVPAAAGEDAGWLMSYVYDAARDRSEFVVLDASNMHAPPVAVVPLPVRVPLGFHGNWIADDAARS
ncbi:MAG TPA: carotenoid oxygenase family protein [Candidatus Lustribacter sp.]|jgi:carotenoid cleavage dioxygenase|nr:carotenoid oxygenase family protein [Candidatus Lustribacter sp.]